MMGAYIRIMVTLVAVLAAALWHWAPVSDPPDPMPAAYRELCDCPPFSQEMRTSLRGIVSFTDDTLFVRTRSGRIFEHKSLRPEEKEDDTVLYCVWDFFPREGILIVEYKLYEGGGYVSFNLANDARVHHDGFFEISPDRTRILNDVGSYGESYYFQILRPTPCGLVQEYIVETSDSLKDCSFSWLDAQTIDVRRYAPDDHEFPSRLVGRIINGPDSWRMYLTVDHPELLDRQ